MVLATTDERQKLKMDRQNLERLKQEQEIALEETNANINQWEKFRTDYKALKTRLKTLPDKVTHDVMVPFGPLAFMPGKLVHTNEILVLLGENWFVERSAKQACGIIDRRAKSIHKEIENLHKQKELLQPRLDAVKGQFSKETDTFDIVEEYNEEKEKKWKAQHKKNVKHYKKTVKGKADESSEEMGKTMTDKELWDRLDELERIESEKREMHKVTSDEILLHKSYDSDDSILSIDTGSGSDSGDADTNDSQARESSSESAESDDEGSEPGSVTKIIKFSHTATKKRASQADNTDDDDDTEATETDIKSPADIYSQFYPTSGPRSILKDDGEKRQTKKSVTLMPSDSTDEVPVPAPVAFSDFVVERSTQMKSSSDTNIGIVQDKPARMSRFKARQQGLDQT
ncbi:unconventional prefoldin RPB5 interactor 1 [Mytilus galloprovincialis]|nr:unconventional prefoldin RPB5 interactor 1 [Mytilus galloprovincialis]